MESSPTLWYPTILVLGPGAEKGFLELGTLLKLEEQGLLSKVKIHVGVSIGAMIALLLNCGCKVDKIIEEASDLDLLEKQPVLQMIETLEHLKANAVEYIKHVSSNMGILSMNPIRERLEAYIRTLFNEIPTLARLYELTGKKFEAVTSNLTTLEPVYLNYENNPELSCVEAVLLSCNVPGLFEKMLYKGEPCIDGALSDPYPVHRYDSGDNKILGIYIDAHNPSQVATDHVSYFHAVTHCSMSIIRNYHIKNASPRVKNIKLELVHPMLIELGNNTKSRANMLRIGYEEGVRCITYIQES